MTVKLIVACNYDLGIGYKGKLPWHCPEDLEHFKEATKGHTVIMGRKTYESLPCYPKGLPFRDNIIVSDTLEMKTDWDKGFSTVVMNLEEVKAHIEKNKGYDQDIFIIGGKSIYEQLD